MSAVVRGYEPHHATDSAALYRASSDRVDVGVYPQGQSAEVAVALPRADFLAAVASECGVIVIDRADLPAVTEHAGGRLQSRPTGHIPVILDDEAERDEVRARGLAYLALAEHLDAHPPVDEAQVEALASALRCEGVGSEPRWSGTDRAATLARSLVARGVRVGADS